MHAILLGPTSPRRSLVERMLNDQGHEVDVVDDIGAARERLESGRIGLLVATGLFGDVVELCDAVLGGVHGASTVVVAVPGSTVELSDAVAEMGSRGCLVASPEPELLRTHLSFAAFHHRARRHLKESEQSRSRDAANALRENEALTRAILETTVDGVITIDESGRVEAFNPAAERIFGYDSEEIIGKNVGMLMPSPYSEEHDTYIRRYLETGRRQVIGIGREVVGQRKDGSTFPLELALSELKLQDRRIFTGVVRDITERRMLEKEILRISDQERRRIGQDMHDGLGQMLTGIGLIGQNLARRLSKNNMPCATDVAEITQLIKEADQYARSLSRSLVPVELEDNGLVHALDRLAGNAERLFGIRCTFEHSGTLPTQSENWSAHLYRIAQEAVSNAVKHGNATHVRVELACGPDRVRLRVQDNGSGLSDSWKQGQGMGVRLMAYRANIIGASLDISNGHGGGAVVRCTLRLREPAEPSSIAPSSISSSYIS